MFVEIVRAIPTFFLNYSVRKNALRYTKTFGSDRNTYIKFFLVYFNHIYHSDFLEAGVLWSENKTWYWNTWFLTTVDFSHSVWKRVIFEFYTSFGMTAFTHCASSIILIVFAVY